MQFTRYKKNDREEKRRFFFYNNYQQEHKLKNEVLIDIQAVIIRV